MSTPLAIEEFLAQTHLAVVGTSRQPKAFPNSVAAHLRKGGRTVYAVNRNADVIDGERCYHSIAELPEPLDGVVIMLKREPALAAVKECVERRVPRVWLHHGAGEGAESPEAIELCRQAGITVIAGACPFMYAEPIALFHKPHRFFAKRRITVS